MIARLASKVSAAGNAAASDAATDAATDAAEYLFVRRPVLAAVISLVILLLGMVSMRSLPINRYPQVTPATIQVTAVYPGASAADVASAVAAPIEQQLSGLDGLLYYRSSNSSDGVLNLSITFDIARNADLAAVDVQNAVRAADPQLPAAVRQNGVQVTKSNTDILMVGALTSTDPSHDAGYLTNYARLYVENELKRMPGVGNLSVFGAQDYAMLISLDPDRMAHLKVTVADVSAAIQEQNATKPAGRIGREPAPEGTELTVSVATRGRLTTAREFEQVIVRADPGGQIVRVGDVGVAHTGARGYDIAGRLNGKPTALFAVYGRPGANTLSVKSAVLGRLSELERVFPPGMKAEIPFDTTPFITESIREVLVTLGEAMVLVMLVVFAFLQSWRATVIPLLAVPISIVGTFIGLTALGYTINTLTLFAMVLAIGIVVDDAIVVIENVERLMREEQLSPRAATSRAMAQVSGALVAIVLVLCAVFVPMAFAGGITGALYTQFAVTVATAVVLSGLVALTLTPALCAVLLRPTDETTLALPFRWFNARFAALTRRYLTAVSVVIDRPRVSLTAFALLVAAAGYLYQRTPSGFLPTEDKGYFAIGVQLPNAAGLQRTAKVVARIEQMLRSEPSVRNTVAIVGLDLLTQSNQSNAATMFVAMEPWEARATARDGLPALLQRLNGKLFALPEAFAFGFNLPEIPGLGTSAGLEMYLQQRTDAPMELFAQSVAQFGQAANSSGSIQGAVSTLRTDVPQLFVALDDAQARTLGVNTGDVFSTLQAMLSNQYVNDFNQFGRAWRVQLEAQDRFRQRPEDLTRFHVRTRNGEMIPLSALVTAEMRTAPTLLTRFNGFPAALVTASPAPGRTSSAMLAAADSIVATDFSARGISAAYSGESYQERNAAGQGLTVALLGILLVFLVLAAQYESWSIPLAVMLALPFGVLGAFIGAQLFGRTNDVYFQIGLITVLGLVAKNAVLIVEFAMSLERSAVEVHDAIRQAARDRFRPILMTSFAFVLGVTPLLVASGAGSASRRSLGTSVFFGMVVATLLGVLFVPLLFVTIRSVTTARRRAPQTGESMQPSGAALS